MYLLVTSGLLGVVLKLLFDYWSDSKWDKKMLRMLEIRDKLEEDGDLPKRKKVIEGEIDRLTSRKESKRQLTDKFFAILLAVTGIGFFLMSILFLKIRNLFLDTLEIYSSIGWEFTEAEVALQIVGLVLLAGAFALLVSYISGVLDRKISSLINNRKQIRNKKEQSSENVNTQEGEQ